MLLSDKKRGQITLLWFIFKEQISALHFVQYRSRNRNKKNKTGNTFSFSAVVDLQGDTKPCFDKWIERTKPFCFLLSCVAHLKNNSGYAPFITFCPHQFRCFFSFWTAGSVCLLLHHAGHNTHLKLLKVLCWCLMESRKE